MKKLLDIIIECSKKGIPSHTGWDEENKSLCFDVDGFSKSGTATLFVKDKEVYSKTRYGQEDKIDNFDDLASIAWDWYIQYSDREVFKNPGCWADVFIEKGWPKEVQTKEYITTR